MDAPVWKPKYYCPYCQLAFEFPHWRKKTPFDDVVVLKNEEEIGVCPRCGNSSIREIGREK